MNHESRLLQGLTKVPGLLLLAIYYFFGFYEPIPHVNSQFNHKQKALNMKVMQDTSLNLKKYKPKKKRVYSLVPFLDQNPSLQLKANLMA
jgi:hypothetical protein